MTNAQVLRVEALREANKLGGTAESIVKRAEKYEKFEKFLADTQAKR